jgi:hypothetical protein
MTVNINVSLSFTRYDSKGDVEENYQNTFNHNDDETFNILMEKFQNMLIALGYELGNNYLGLIEHSNDEEDMGENVISFPDKD